MTVTFDEQSRTWLLDMPTSSYGLALMGLGSVPCHRHWGRPLGHRALGEMAATSPSGVDVDQWVWGEGEPLEYVAWGGRRYDEPSLKVDYPDGTRSI